MKKKIIWATNGCQDAPDALEYAVWLAKNFSCSLTLLGVIETSNDEHPVQDVFSTAVPYFKEEGIEYELQLINGQTETILKEKKWEDNEILFVSTLGRSPLHHFFLRRTFHQIIEDVPVPILYMRDAKIPIKKILVCFGGLGHAERANKYAVEIASQMNAQLTLLHVVPPVELDYPPIKEMQENWDHLLDTDTPPAQELLQAREYGREKGIEPQISLRHGDPINQIIRELEENEYDLICMGSAHSHPSLRQLYTPNVTAEIAESINCPILTVRCDCQVTNPE